MNFTDKIFSIKHSSDLSHNLVSVLGMQIKINLNVFHKYNKMPIVNNRIVFNNFNGKGYGCNPKYIAEEILRQNLPYELVWLSNDETNIFPQGIKVIDYNSEEAFEALATAKCIISNSRLYNFIKGGFVKKQNQIYIQTWHGGLAFKKIERDIENNKHYAKYLKIAKIDSKYTNYLLSPSKFDTKCLKHNFYFDGEFLEYGYPRNDLFFYDEEEKNKIKDKVYTKLNIPKDKKIVLYAPTFRDSNTLDVYKIDTERLLETLHRKYNNDFVFVTRLHPNMQKKFAEMSELLPNSINASDYDDIQELLLASDILITDYSSCMFDYILSKQPCFIFATDIKDYLNERGFYYSLDSTPFPIAKNNDELKKNIETFDYGKYRAEVEDFLKEKGSTEDGHAAERIVDLIQKRTKG